MFELHCTLFRARLEIEPLRLYVIFGAIRPLTMFFCYTDQHGVVNFRKKAIS